MEGGRGDSAVSWMAQSGEATTSQVQKPLEEATNFSTRDPFLRNSDFDCGPLFINRRALVCRNEDFLGEC